jgi:hypothetical protein
MLGVSRRIVASAKARVEGMTTSAPSCSKGKHTGEKGYSSRAALLNKRRA